MNYSTDVRLGSVGSRGGCERGWSGPRWGLVARLNAGASAQGCADACEADILRVRLSKIYEGSAGNAGQCAKALMKTLAFQAT
jgi:hypothetical protein